MKIRIQYTSSRQHYWVWCVYVLAGGLINSLWFHNRFVYWVCRILTKPACKVRARGVILYKNLYQKSYIFYVTLGFFPNNHMSQPTQVGHWTHIWYEISRLYIDILFPLFFNHKYIKIHQCLSQVAPFCFSVIVAFTIKPKHNSEHNTDIDT